MSKSLVVLTLGAFLIAFLVPPMAEAARDRSGSRDDSWESRTEKIPAERMNKAFARAEARGLFGKFSFDLATQKATGKFVNFTWDSSTKSVKNYTVRGAPVLDSLSLSPALNVTKVKNVGSVLRVRGSNGGIAIHNNPLGLIRVHANASLTATFTLPAGAATAAFGDAGKSIRINYAAPHNATHAHVVRLGNATIANSTGTITVTMGDGDGLLFAVHPPATNFKHLEKSFHSELLATSKGHYGGSIDVISADGSPVDVPVDLGVGLSTQSMAAGRVVIKATGEGKGRVVLIRIDPDVFMKAKVKVKLDGQDVAVGNDTTVTLGTEPTSAAASVETTDETVTAAVSLSSFSDHTITIESESAATTSAAATSETAGAARGTPALGLTLIVAGVLVGLAGVRRRP